MVPPNSTPSREGSTNSAISQERSYPPSSNSGNTRSQAGNRSASSQAVRCSARLRASQASQADSIIPQVDTKVSLVSRASSQAVRHSTRLRASQADSNLPQVDSEVSQASGASPPNSAASQATSNTGSQEAGAIPPTSNNNKQACSRSGRGNRHSAS